MDFREEAIEAGIPEEVVEEAMAAVAELWAYRNEEWARPDPNQRLSLALGFTQDSKPRLSIYVDRSEGPAALLAEQLSAKHGSLVTWGEGGEAQSSYPDSAGQFIRSKSGKLVPGISLGHRRYRGASLGCMVQVEDGGEKIIAATAAAHSVSLNEGAKIDDPIFAPGRPDTENVTARSQVGLIYNHIVLTPIISAAREEPEEDISASADIALIKLQGYDGREPEWENVVPDPQNPTNKTIDIKSVFPSKNLLELGRSKQKVFKIGRTTRFTTGIVDEYRVLERSIALPNKKLYLYRDLFAVRGEGNKSFSESGDSGAPVYLEDGRLVGFVVGGMGSRTLCCRADVALASMQAVLI